jgi:hypothetical protein
MGAAYARRCIAELEQVKTAQDELLRKASRERDEARAEMRAVLDATRMEGDNIIVDEVAFTRAMNLIVEWFDS